jgi:hypothetical protein
MNDLYYGLYRGICVNSDDPEGLGRITASVPTVFIDSTIATDWAWPMFPSGIYIAPPAPNSGVWIGFEGGDTQYPYWSGTWINSTDTTGPYDPAGSAAAAEAAAIATSETYTNSQIGFLSGLARLTVVSQPATTPNHVAANGQLFEVNATSGTFGVTSPTAVKNTVFGAIKTDAVSTNPVTITFASGTWNGQSSLKLYGEGAGMVFICDGTNWLTLSEIPSIWTSYPCEWSANGGAPVLGNGSLSSIFRQTGITIQLYIELEFGSTTSGGTEYWLFTLPINNGSSPPERDFFCKGDTSDGLNWVGFAYVPANDNNLITYLSASRTSAYLEAVQNCDSSSGVGTGVPLVSGNYSFTAGSNISISGTYSTV